ncbi:MAG: hypothetical protein IT436_18565, partial [Phycisphaerales bacterium]|nr:hypothetical protein [Phycisphaerales bacterium]
TRPGAAMARYDLYVDGVFWSTISAAAPQLNLNTTLLDDGWHDIRVLGYDNTLIKPDGRWQRGLTVNNAGLSAGLSVAPASGDLGTLYQFSASGSGGLVKELRLLHNGRVIGSTPSGSGTIPVYGQTIGAGASQVRVEAVYADGRIASSPPVPVTIAFSGGSPTGVVPTAFGYTQRLTPAASAIIELPASYNADPATAQYTPLQLPAQASIIGGPNNAYVMITPNPGAAGVDTMTFRVTTPGGNSNVATIRLVYSGPLFPCAADLTGDGVIDFSDYLEFLNLYDAADPRVDFTGDGVVDFSDYLEFLNFYEAGC